jgi:hypothetical protein
LLDPPHRIAVECLARVIPLNWPPLHDGRDLSPTPVEPLPDELEAFAVRADLRLFERLLEEAELLPELLLDRCGWRLIPGDETATASTLVLAALARATAGHAPRPEPLEPAKAAAFGEQVTSVGEEQLCADALAVLAPLAGVEPTGADHPTSEDDPARRLLLRLILLGRARLGADDPLHVLPLAGE